MNKNKHLKARSAGVILGNKVSPHIMNLAKEFGVKIKNPPHNLTSKILDWQDLTIIVANDVPKEVFTKNNMYFKKILVWKVPDAHHDTRAERMHIIPLIKKHVTKLVQDLAEA